MASCKKCDGFSERFNVPNPDEYQNLVRQLIQIVNEGTFLLVHADCPLDEILRPTLPGDFVAHEFECFACGRQFRLAADTYHGNVSWTPGDVPRDKPTKPN